MHPPSLPRISITIAGALLACLLVGAPVAADEKAAAEYYEDAAMRFEQKDYAAAVIQLKNALQQHPDHRPAQILLGRTYLAMGEPAAAEEHLLNARNVGVDEALIVLPLAEAYLAQRKFKEVILNLRYSGYAPEIEYRLRTYQGAAHRQLGELDRALQAYSDAQRLDPSAPEPIAGEAMVLLLQGNLELAGSKTRLAVERSPESPDAWFSAASVNHARGEIDVAVEQYSKVLDLKSEHMEARLARANLLMDLNRNAEAATDLEDLRIRFPFEPRVTYLQAVLLGKEGDKAKSLELLSETAQMLNALPDSVIAGEVSLQLLGGLANYSIKAYEQAETFLKRFLTTRPMDPGARRMLGDIYLSRGEYTGVVDVLKPLLESTPNDPRVLHMMGTAYARQGRQQDGLLLLERAAQASGGASEIRTDLALTRLSLNQTSAALEDLRAVMAADPGQMRAGMTLAALLLRSAEFAEAVALAEGLRERHPDSTVAQNLLATALFRSGKRGEAARLFEQVVRRDPTFLPARVNLAKIDIMEGRSAQAQARYLQILENHPKHVGTMLELAKLLDGLGRAQEAIKWGVKALDAQPRNVAAVVYLVDLYLRNDDQAEALSLARAAETWAPDDARLLMALARAYLAENKLAVAKAILQRLATAAGYDTPTLVQIAAMQQRANAPDDAAWSLQKAVEGEPDSIDARVRLVAALVQLRRYDSALEAAQELREMAPESRAGFGALGEVLAASGRPVEALEQFRLALDKAPSDFTAVKYAQALADTQPDESVAWIRDWLQKHPDHRLMRQLQAEYHLRTGAYAKARADYEQLVKWRPEDPQLLNNYANVLARLGDPRALGIAEQAHEKAPGDADINDTLGWLLVQAGDAQRGLRFLRNAYSRAGLNPAIRYHTAAALAELGRTAEALREVDAALKSQRSFREREDAVALMARLKE